MIRRAMLLLALFVSSSVYARSMDVGEYIAALAHIDALLAANQVEPARAEARAMIGSEVTSPQGNFHADASLLQTVADPRIPVPQSRMRLTRTIAELQHATGIEGSAADRRLLEEVTQAQKVEALPAGGEIQHVAVQTSMIERILESVEKMRQWIAEKLAKLLDWIFDLFPDSARQAPGATVGMRGMVLALTVAIALLFVVLAWRAIRRSQRAARKTVASSEAPIGSERDADPLSRGAGEWERYAIQLGSAGKYREGIRAWFHAVLVTCYSEGILHFHKGRTNWEYLAALSPSYEWRPELIELTRRFELEWYGSDASAEEAFEECGARARNILDALHRSGGIAA